MTKPLLLTGLVVCGGASSRMGQDKSLLRYGALPQREAMTALLQPYCSEVYLSLNAAQFSDYRGRQPVIRDLPAYRDTGPMAALLSAFKILGGTGNLLVTGCDYPLLDHSVLRRFVGFLRQDTTAAAFYNTKADLYEPLLGYYAAAAAPLLQEEFEAGNNSLQRFLRKYGAERFYPASTECLFSADDPDDFVKARSYLERKSRNEAAE